VALDVIEVPLQRFWDLRKYTQGKPKRNRGTADDADAVGDVFAFDAAVRNKRVFMYACMLRQLLGLVEELRAWFEMCPCHGKPIELPERDRNGKNVKLDAGMSDCPLRSCRGPELAAGELEGTFEKAIQISTCVLESDLSPAPTSETDAIMFDFREGHRHLLFMIVLKLSFWTSLPHLLLGMLHHIEEAARACAKRCLDMWEATQVLFAGDASALSRIHPLSVLFLHPSGELRAFVLVFAQGCSRNSDRLQVLWSALAAFVFTPVVSRTIEGRHGRLKGILERCPSATAARPYNSYW